MPCDGADERQVLRLGGDSEELARLQVHRYLDGEARIPVEVLVRRHQGKPDRLSRGTQLPSRPGSRGGVVASARCSLRHHASPDRPPDRRGQLHRVGDHHRDLRAERDPGPAPSRCVHPRVRGPFLAQMSAASGQRVAGGRRGARGGGNGPGGRGGRERGTETTARLRRRAAAGQAVFASAGCNACHSLADAGATSSSARPRVREAARRARRRPRDERQGRDAVVQGRADLGAGRRTSRPLVSSVAGSVVAGFVRRPMTKPPSTGKPSRSREQARASAWAEVRGGSVDDSSS